MKKKQHSSVGSRADDRSQTPTRPRRSTLKRLATGGALAGVVAAMPSRWTRPVVESVVLPTHAQTSGEPDREPDGDFFLVERRRVGRKPSWLEWLVPTAHAQTQDCVLCGGCARIRNRQITLSVLATLPETNTLIACYEGTGGIGDTVNLNPVGSELTCGVPSVRFARLEGKAPNRTLVISDNEFEEELFEDPTRTCGCGALSCSDLPENCLLHGMPVLLPGGRSRPIETLSIGDIVAARDHRTRDIQPAVVTRIVKDHMRGEYWRINDSLLITNDHPVLVAEGTNLSWRRVDALSVGMEIQGVQGRAAVTSMERVVERVETVYMETTADNFIAVPGGAEFVVKAGYGAGFRRSRSNEVATVDA